MLPFCQTRRLSLITVISAWKILSGLVVGRWFWYLILLKKHQLLLAYPDWTHIRPLHPYPTPLWEGIKNEFKFNSKRLRVFMLLSRNVNLLSRLECPLLQTTNRENSLSLRADFAVNCLQYKSIYIFDIIRSSRKRLIKWSLVTLTLSNNLLSCFHNLSW